jgi:peptidoglycan/xylan/chitin deacetylase (PgdA/CDA1 family)
MKKTFKFCSAPLATQQRNKHNKKIRFLVFAGLLFCGCLKFDIVFANTSFVSVIDPLHKENSSKYHLITCKGTSSIHTTRRIIALTFDDGPSMKHTKQVLGVLKLNNIKGTFFFIGKNARKYQKIVREAYNNGHVIGNHSYSHYHLNRLNGEDIENELTKTSELIEKIIGVYPLLFRPPYGACSLESVRVARNLHFKTIMWSAMVDDYHVDRTTSEKIASQILGLVHPGAIIGLHDGGGNREKTVEALQIIIKALQNEGYEFVTIPELLGINPYDERLVSVCDDTCKVAQN